MDETFKFTPKQARNIANLLGLKSAVPVFERLVGEFRARSGEHMTARQLKKHISEIAKLSLELRGHLEELKGECGQDATWILEPLGLCERYSTGLYDYQFSGALPLGRPSDGARNDLIKAAASYWQHVLKREPASWDGDFPTLVELLLEYSEVPGAVVESLEQSISRAIRGRVSLTVPDSRYPFEIDMDKARKLPEPRRSAENFFSAFVLNQQEPAWPKRPTRSAKKQMRKKS